MLRTGLSVALVACLALSASAVAEPDEGSPSNSSVVPVREYLEQAAKSPLGPDDVDLLRAVADLLEKEPVAKESAEPRSRQVVRLRNVPAADVAEAMARYVKYECGGRAFFVSEPKSNSLLLSATPDEAAALLELIANLDVPPATIMVSVWFGELTYAADDAKKDGKAGVDLPAAVGFLQGEEAEAWLAEVKKQGHLRVFSESYVLTVDNQPASFHSGGLVPVVAPRPAEESTEEHPVEQAKIGVTIGLTCRVTPEGSVLVELDFEHSKLTGRDVTGRAVIQTTAVQTTIAADDGQTTVLGGMTKKVEDGHRELIIAVTPWVNPKL